MRCSLVSARWGVSGAHAAEKVGYSTSTIKFPTLTWICGLVCRSRSPLSRYRRPGVVKKLHERLSTCVEQAVGQHGSPDQCCDKLRAHTMLPHMRRNYVYTAAEGIAVAVQAASRCGNCSCSRGSGRLPPRHIIVFNLFLSPSTSVPLHRRPSQACMKGNKRRGVQ